MTVAWWASLRRRRRLGRAVLAFLLGAAVVVESAERGAGALGPWSGFLGMIALIVLVAGLVQGSIRVIGAATGLLGAAAILAGNGRLNGLHGAVEDAVVAACLLLVVEVGSWSAEARVRGAAPPPHGRDVRRAAFVLGVAIGGGALAGLAVAIAATTRGVLVGVLPVVGAAAAGCLVLLLALTLAAPER